MTDKDVKLIHEEEYDEIININLVDENNEPIVEILMPEKTVIDNNIEIETANLKCDKKTVVEQDKIDKIIEESLQDNSNVDVKYERTRLEKLEESKEEVEEKENFQNNIVRVKNTQEGILQLFY